MTRRNDIDLEQVDCLHIAGQLTKTRKTDVINQSRLKTFGEWTANASTKQLEQATKLAGAPAALYERVKKSIEGESE